MKLMKCLLISFLLVPFALSASAKSEGYDNESDPDFINTNIGEDGKRIRGSYLTNPWYSNWSVSVQGGVQTLVAGTEDHNKGFDLNTAEITPSVELTIAKWFTPVIGVRAGAQGLWLEEYFDIPSFQGNFNHYRPKQDSGTNHNYYSETYFHGDVMWNFVNTIWGYRAKRFYNIVPYAQVGYMRLVHPDDPLFSKDRCDRELELGAGIYNTFRISNAFLFSIDLRWGGLDGRYHDVSNGALVNHFSAQAGIAYNIEKWYWARSRGIENQRDLALASADAANASAASANASADEARKALNDAMRKNKDMEDQLKDAQDEVNKYQQLANQNVIGLTPEQVKALTQEEFQRLTSDEFQQRVKAAELIVYYQINISKLNFSEKHHLDDYVKTTLARDPKHVFYLTGSADEGTGNFEINTRLSKERAEGVRDILINEYGVPAEQVVIKATIISSEHVDDGSLDRCVLLENN